MALFAIFLFTITSAMIFYNPSAVATTDGCSWFGGYFTSMCTMPFFLQQTKSEEVAPLSARISDYAFAKNAFQHSRDSSTDLYFVDSGCSYSIINSTESLSNIHDIPPVSIEGYAGARVITKSATLTLSVPDFDGNNYPLIVHNVLYDPLATVNLISAKQLTNEGFGLILLPGDGAKALALPAGHSHSSPGLLLLEDRNVFYLMHSTHDTPAPAVAYKSFYNISIEELMHL